MVCDFRWRDVIVACFRRIVEAHAEQLGQRVNVAIYALSLVVGVDLIPVQTRAEEFSGQRSGWGVHTSRGLLPSIDGGLKSIRFR